MEKAPLITLDAVHTKDVDDAFSYVRNEDGHLITVAIANAAAHVEKGSDVDLAAQKRAATLYAASRVRVGMLPNRISEGVGSLVEASAREALVFRIQLDPALNVTSFTPSAETVIVDKRLHYEDIGTLLNTPENPFCRVLQAATGIAQVLLAARRKQGALAFYDLTRMLASSEEGAVIKYKDAGETLGHILVQEFMILTNRLVAEYLLKHNIPAVFRNHEAKVSSPPSKDLAQSLEAWMAGDVDIATLQQKVHLIAARAEYSATALGHYGLTLPAYVHSTSPLRRYPDLVVQRQLLAHLSGKPQPYSQDELPVLCANINQTLIEQDEARSESFKATLRRKAEKALANDSYARLLDHELIKAIELAAPSGTLPEELGLELSTRFDSGAVPDKVSYALLNEAVHTDLPATLKHSLRNWFEATPLRAISYLNHASQSGVLSLTLQTVHTPQGFNSSGNLVVPPRKEGGRPEGLHQTGFGNTKKVAEQMCAIRLLFALLSLEASQAFEAALMTSSQAQLGNPNANAKSRLMELCQSQKWQTPSFTGTHSGADHARVFDCKAALVVKSQHFEGKASGHASKKAAEVAAAGALLRTLKEAGTLAEGAKADLTTANGNKNAISVLQEWAQRKNVVLPSYVLQPAASGQSGFHCALTVPGLPDTFTATAPSKQDAKLAAARQALKALEQKLQS